MSSIPDFLYVNVDPLQVSLVLTVPHLSINLPLNPTTQPQTGAVIVLLKNNGRFKLDPATPIGIRARDYSAKTEIQTVSWQNSTFSGQELLSQKTQLLERFLEQALSGKDNVDLLRTQNTEAGLGKGQFLHKAITVWEFQELKKERAKYVFPDDQNSFFEAEHEFNQEHSQVKSQSTSSSDFTGQIIRWKIEEPLLYRSSGVSDPKVTPFFPHYLPILIEISQDGGKNFVNVNS